MKKIDKEKFIDYLIFLLVCINPFLDIFYFNRPGSVEILGITIPTVIRFLLLGIIIILYIFKKRDIKFFLGYGILLIIYALIQKVTIGSLANYSFLMDFKYIIVLALPIIFGYIVFKSDFDLKMFTKVSLILGIVISLFIIIPDIFKFGIASYSDNIVDYSIFEWYKKPNFIYSACKGIFKISTISSAILLIIPYIFYKSIKNNKFIILLVSLILSGIIIGTRASAIGCVLTFIVCLIMYIFFSFVNKEHDFNKFKFITYLIISAVSILVLFNSPSMYRIKSDNEKEKEEAEEMDYKLLDKNGDQIICEDYSDEEIINKIDSAKSNYVGDYYLKKVYPYEKDAKFWCNVINGYTIFEQSNSRVVQRLILDRVKEKDNNKYEDLFGMSFSRATKIHNLEKDFRYQYYTLGMVGTTITIGLYILVLIITCIYILANFKSKFSNLNCSLILGIAVVILFSYVSGNTLDNLGVMLPFGLYYGMLVKNVFRKEN